jgi:hypothetical protein
MLDGVKEQILAALIRRRAPIDPEVLAGPLGLAELRVGAQRAGADDGPEVLAWWAATVEPSCDPPLAVGAVHEEDWTGGPGPGPVTIRGFVVAGPKAAVATLSVDPVPDALGRLNPFQVEPAHRVLRHMPGVDGEAAEESWVEVCTLDGLAYGLEWGTKAVSDGVLRFSNPEAGWPLEFERLLFRFASQVVAAAGLDFEAELACWARYRKGIAADAARALDRSGHE